MVEDMCLLVVLIGRLGRHGAGLVGMLNEVPATFSTKEADLKAHCSVRALRACVVCFFQVCLSRHVHLIALSSIY